MLSRPSLNEMNIQQQQPVGLLNIPTNLILLSRRNEMALSMHVFGLRAAFLGDLGICLPLNVNAQRYIEDTQITSRALLVMVTKHD